MTRIIRFEVIDENGRSYVNWEDDNDVSWQLQDNEKTLKVFVNKVKQEPDNLQDWLGPEPPEEPKLSPIEQTKKDIETPQQKLKLLEYEETVRTDEEKSYRDVYGYFPVTDMSANDYDVSTWIAFSRGYQAGKKSKENSK